MMQTSRARGWERPPRTEIEPLQILAIDARVAGKTLKDISEEYSTS